MGERERIILVEDNRFIRETAADYLEMAGHQVVFQAGDMPTALQGVQAAPELGVTVGVVDGNLTEGDLTCDDGRNLAAALRTAVPGIKIVSFSGSPNADYGDVSINKSDPKINACAELAKAVTGL